MNLLNPSNLIEFIQHLIFDRQWLWVTCILLFIAEIVVNLAVIYKVPYTEIDWKAYMSEVEGFLNGTYDYTKLEGGTGPLVYPAGFVYLFSALYYITDHGTNIKLAQYIFMVFYMINLAAVFYIYHKCQKVPPYAMFFICCTSYRIHSIFILRLFNDPIAMIFLYFSIICFIHNYWKIGCTLFSLGVGIKMNILLFAPGLFIVMVNKLGLVSCIGNVVICAVIQLALGLPFLYVNAVGYIARSFNLGRQFFFIWTVNWRFLPEWIFLSRTFHIVLLSLHIIVLGLFIFKKWSGPAAGWFTWLKELNVNKPVNVNLSSEDIVKILFTSNFIGMCFARSLHYQFYIWYFHTLPFILWNVKGSPVLRLLVLGIIEMCWNTYPSTNLSSCALHICHFIILVGSIYFEESVSPKKENEKSDRKSVV